MNDWSMLKKLIWLHIVKGGGGIERTVKGAIVHVINALARPAISVKCEVNPIQDLHGYDSPWPAGGGKNKMPPPTSISQPIHGTATDNNGKISISTDGNSATFEVYIPPFTFAESGQKIEMLNSFTGATIYFFNGTTQVDYFSMSTQNRVINSASMTALLGKTIDRYRLTINAQSLTGGTFGLMVTPESDPALTTFAPYSNICPISGRTSATVTRTGKNLLNLVESEMVSSGWNRSFPINVKAGTYIISCQNQFGAGSTFGARTVLKDSDNNIVVMLASDYTFGRTVFSWSAVTITEEQAKLIKNITFECRAGDATASDITRGNIQLELGSTASAYEPYAGNTYSIALGDTVYGGQLDVTAGKMVVDRAMVTFDANNTDSVSYYAFTDLGLSRITWNPYNQIGVGNTVFVSDVFKSLPPANYPNASSVWGVGNNQNPTAPRMFIYFPLELIGSVNDFRSYCALNPFSVVYTLATPIEITLTPQQIDMLLGENNLWADAGDSTLTYYADGNASTSEALGILLGGTYNNTGGADDVSDDEALEILLGGS